jgi:sec-independent protein translocase protein TatA
VRRPGLARAAHSALQPKGPAMNLGPTELIIVLAIIMLLFGAAKLPKLARSLGESAKEFKSATAAIESVDEPRDIKS